MQRLLFKKIQRDHKSYELQSDVSAGLGRNTDVFRQRLHVSYDSVFPGGWGERFIFEEQVPGGTPGGLSAPP